MQLVHLFVLVTLRLGGGLVLGVGLVWVLAPHHPLPFQVGGCAHLHFMDTGLAPLARLVVIRQNGSGSGTISVGTRTGDS